MRRDGERVRITAQLIRVQDQIHLWAENYDRQLPGILDIHGEIGAAIADQVKLKLIGGGEASAHTELPLADAEAHDQYLRGRYHYARFNLLDAQKAVAYFQQARERDPSFVLAHCGLADALMVFTLSGDIATQTGVFNRPKSAIAQALRLDPESAEAHTSDSSIKFWFDWDYKGAELAARKAIRLNENYSLAHVYLAHVLSNTGRYDQAMAAIQQAMVLDPLSLFVGAMRGQVSLYTLVNRCRIGGAIQYDLRHGAAILDRADLCGEGLREAGHALGGAGGVRSCRTVFRWEFGGIINRGVCTCGRGRPRQGGRIHSADDGAEEGAVRASL